MRLSSYKKVRSPVTSLETLTKHNFYCRCDNSGVLPCVSSDWLAVNLEGNIAHVKMHDGLKNTTL